MRYFVYCRKSTESEDRQVLSLDSQRSEIERFFGNQPSIEIIEVLSEARSAKAPGRPIFDQMIKRVEKGEAEGIIAWHPDRLARNSVDGGRIIYLLDQRVLKDLKFASASFENSPNGKMMLSTLFTFSKYYVDNLSENVKRGNRTKVERGWRPGPVPAGYRNCKETKTIIPDPEQFPLVQKLFRLALTEAYTVKQLLVKANDEWGYRTPKHKRSGGRPLALSSLYKILANPYYTGHFVWNGKLYPGKHTPMITTAEFQQLQKWLGRPGTEKPQRYRFPFTGMIRCGACGLMITAEHKINRYGSRYTYYHCTKRNIGERCAQPSVEAEALEGQIVEFLTSLQIDANIHHFLVDSALEVGKAEQDKQLIQAQLERSLAQVRQQRDTLIDLRVRGLVSDEEFTQRRQKLYLDETSLTERAGALDRADNWFEPAKLLISFSNRAAECFLTGDEEAKRLILKTVSANLSMTDKKLSIQAAEPFTMIAKSPGILQRCGFVDDVRTLIQSEDPDTMQRIANIRAIKARLPLHLL